MIRSYRTTSFVANTTLAGIPPLALEARRQEEVYLRISEMRKNIPLGTIVLKDRIDAVKDASRKKMVRNWKEWLTGVNIQGDMEYIRAIEGQLQEWMDARMGLSFRATQVLTGHGCFGRYLCRIGREATQKCWHCDAENDSAKHTLRYCPAWDRERGTLTEKIGVNLTGEAIIRELRGKEGRRAFINFCEEVMKKKEAAGRARERAILGTT
ncbi:PREDICTED: uncharacterized protein LOC108758224 [Trachymyrmex cornetzi]|uniref:uncharacterized protein LOC108758224 n=1 Tax=Trachymyrmex cornetzi TaxID=471704 RepID=UPI00084F5131|nr:PREDICTED: uncharacterized protein LOC108758224 [Trachymyrmex cornetzi]